MSRRRAPTTKTAATIGITALSAGLVIAALALTGGPTHARKEYRDNVRLEDLRAIQQHIACSVTNATDPLPDQPTAVAGCGAMPRMRDPYSDVPYQYQVLDLRTIRLCAGFELPADPRRMPEDANADEAVGAGPNCRDFRIARGS